MSNQIPRLQAWKSASSVGGATRSKDAALSRIDELVQLHGRSNEGDEKRYLLGEIYFATNYWLRNSKLNYKGTHKERTGAIRDLLQCAARLLARSFQCSVQALPNELEWMYGRTMSAHGRGIESGADRAYMNRNKAEAYKLRFRNGVAWRFPFDFGHRGPVVGQLIRADTRQHYGNPAKVLDAQDGYEFCVLSMARDLYVGPHFSFNTRGAVAENHSSWLAWRFSVQDLSVSSMEKSQICAPTAVTINPPTITSSTFWRCSRSRGSSSGMCGSRVIIVRPWGMEMWSSTTAGISRP